MLTSSCSALAGTKEQGEAPSGARVAKAHSDVGRFPKRVLGRKSQSRAHYGQLHRPHECGRPDGSGVPHSAQALSLVALGLKQCSAKACHGQAAPSRLLR